MEIIRAGSVGTAGHAVGTVLPAAHFFTHGGKQYGSGVVNYLNRALARRSAHLGLSLVRLCSLGPFRGAADCHHRVAPHWPNMKGAVIQSRGAPCHSTPICTIHLCYSPACSPWCCAWHLPRRPGRPRCTPGVSLARRLTIRASMLARC